MQINNPFNAPVFHEETVISTMEISRVLAGKGEPHGTVITTDFQQAGRGRIRDRKWESEKSESLLFTILLRFLGIEKIPPALTLRAGLAASRAIEEFAPDLKDMIMVKWPNDIIINSKKTAGILCEADSTVHLGIGINVFQKEFPPHLRDKATSIALASPNRNFKHGEHFCLLEKLLACLYSEFETAKGNDWQNRLQQRLYKRGDKVIFVEGAAGSRHAIEGRLEGIGSGGELLIIPAGGGKVRAFVNGELHWGSDSFLP
jgi:BirA family biotin operon repressor/biotin-[acetyl-CoA-carboxylase] ligase